MSFGIGTFAGTDGAPFAGLVADGKVTDLRPHFEDRVTVLGLFEDWDISLSALEQVDRSGGTPVADLKVLPPINPAGPFICAGANYRTHVIEMRTANAVRQGKDSAAAAADAAREMDERAANGTPFAWIGWPGAVIGANDDIVIPDDGSHEHDWEIELAVVIGRHARCVAKEEAMDYIAGYTILNDVSTRDRMHRADVRFTDFLSSKNRPTFKPIGPWITPAKFVKDPHDLHMELKVNGETMQDDRSNDMIFKIDRMLEYISGMGDLRPGDIVATGSPAGNAGHHGDKFLKPGDVMEGTIEGLGTQINHCIAAEKSPQGSDLSKAFKPRPV